MYNFAWIKVERLEFWTAIEAAQNVSIKKVSNPKAETIKPPGKSAAKHNFPKFDEQELQEIEKYFVPSKRKSISRSRPPIIETGF